MTTTLNKIAYENLQDELVVDIRDNTTFRQGHLPNSLNVTAKQKTNTGMAWSKQRKPRHPYR